MPESTVAPRCEVGSGKVSPLDCDVSKRLGTLVKACKAGESFASGLQSGVFAFEAINSSIGDRVGSLEARQTLQPLVRAINMAKIIIRKEHKILVTPKMQRHLHDVIVWHAGCAEEIFVGGNLHKKKNKEILDLQAKEARLIRAIEGAERKKSKPMRSAKPTPSAPSPDPSSSATVPSRNGSSSMNRTRSTRPSRVGRQPLDVGGHASVSPWTMKARKPSVRVDPRATHIVGSGALCR